MRDRSHFISRNSVVAFALAFSLFFPTTKNRHFDRSRSRLCERRSGEIRFSATALSRPPQLK
jgi:hypothetical protein